MFSNILSAVTGQLLPVLIDGLVGLVNGNGGTGDALERDISEVEAVAGRILGELVCAVAPQRTKDEVRDTLAVTVRYLDSQLSDDGGTDGGGGDV